MERPDWKVFRKKPVEIEAFQITRESLLKLFDKTKRTVIINGISCLCNVRFIGEEIVPFEVHIHTLEGIMVAGYDDWIICGIEGEIYPIKSTIFEKTYEQVEDGK